MSQLATAPQLDIKLPKLHSGQVEIVQNAARFKVVVCGRRWGKTTLGIWLCLRGAIQDPGIYWWVGPTFPSVQSSGAWEMLKNIVSLIPGTEIREADKEVILVNGSQIWIKTAKDPDSLRGPKLKGVVLDEFSQTQSRAWTEVLRPALTDYRGWALFIGTPKGKNWAYRLFQTAQTRVGWAAFKKPTTNNPFIDPKEIEDARLDMSDNEFKQEYEADFGASQYLVYEEVDPQVHMWRGDTPEFVSYHGGMDFGGDTIGAHKSATVIAGKTKADELLVIAAFEQAGPNIAERQVNWTLQQEQTLAEIHGKLRMPFHGVTYRADKTQSLGIQFMARMGIRVYPTKGGPDSVDEGIQLVHRRLEVRNGKPKLFWLKEVPWVQAAMMRYRYPEPRADGSVQSKNPLKVDDDTVDALRYMVEGVDRLVVGNPQELYKSLIPGVR